MTVLDDLSIATGQVNHWLGKNCPETAIVLGSGLAGIVGHLETSIQYPYQNLAGFPRPGVDGHTGQLHCGFLADQQVLVFEGRYHVYEGYSAWQVTAPVRLAAALGCRKIVLTNAVGGISPELKVGEFMLVADHLNLTGQNPLIGRSEVNFVDLSNLYTTHFFSDLKQRAELFEIVLHTGVLAWMLGPSYETPAEIRALRQLGADAVSMSTVPETIVSGFLGLDVVAVSYISNAAAGCGSERLDHQDILYSGRRAAGNLASLLKLLFPLWNEVN